MNDRGPNSGGWGVHLALGEHRYEAPLVGPFQSMAPREAPGDRRMPLETEDGYRTRPDGLPLERLHDVHNGFEGRLRKVKFADGFRQSLHLSGFHEDLSCHVHEFFDRPHARGDAGSHGRRHAERAMDLREVVRPQVNGDGCAKVLDLFREAVG